MRRKNRVTKASQGVVEVNASTCLKAGEKTLSGCKNPAGRGLGKAGAKRLGRLLKRVIQPQEEPAGKGKASLPKTPVRLFKHQIEKKGSDAPEGKSSKQQVSKLILDVVSQCKHKGGISMVELKQTLAAEGYNVAKTNRQVKMVTERLVNNETLVRTTRNTSFKLSRKRVRETMTVKMKRATCQKPTWELRRRNPIRKSPEEATDSPRNYTKAPKAKGRTQKRKRNGDRAAGKSQKQIRQTPKLRGKSQKTARKGAQVTKKQTTKSQQPTARVKRTQRRQLKQVKSSRRRQPQGQKPPKASSRLQTKNRRNTRRTKRH